MPWTIPKQTVTVLKRESRGIAVWALQKALDDLRGYALTTDGAFGPQTYEAVTAFQSRKGLTVDGIAGLQTQRALTTDHIRQIEEQEVLPANLLTGFAQAEGGWYLGAVNWSVGGGVDCGVWQRRVYEGDYGNDAAIERAFNTRYQCLLLANRLSELRAIFQPRAGTNDGTLPPREKAWRLAALNHNYPYAADKLSRERITDLSAYWRTPQQWVENIGAVFPDGSKARTPLDWCHFYAGIFAPAKGWKGSVTRSVSDWSV